MVNRPPLPLLVFARSPDSGRTKTRLRETLGSAAAEVLYGAFLDDLLGRCSTLDHVELHIAAADEADVSNLKSRYPRVPVLQQSPGDLGRRMATALEWGIARAGRALVVGSDAPTLPRRLLQAAATTLERESLVLGPAADGGYYLIGARGAVPDVFAGIPWSTADVLTGTLERASAAGLPVCLLPPWYDVDRADDVRLLRAHLALDPGAAKETARVLSRLT